MVEKLPSNEAEARKNAENAVLNEFEVLEKATAIIERNITDTETKQRLLEAIATIEPSAENADIVTNKVETKLALAKKQSEINLAKQLVLQAVSLSLMIEEVGELSDANITTLYKSIQTYLERKREYQEIIKEDNNTLSEEELGNIIVAKSTELQTLLGLDERYTLMWKEQLQNLQKSLPAPPKTGVDNGTSAYLGMQYEELLKTRSATINMFTLYNQLLEINPNDTVSKENRAILLQSVTQYNKKRIEYLADVNPDKKIPDALTAGLMNAGGEIAEEIGENVFDGLGKMEGIKLSGASAWVRIQLAKMGMKETPQLLNVLLKGAGAGPKLLRETVRVVSPEGAGSILFYAYYLHIAEDKTKAMLNYSVFMAAGKGLDIAPAALARIGARVPGLAKYMPRLAKLKIPAAAKLGILLVAAWGFGEEIDAVFTTVERNADPTAYDVAGNVMGVISAPLDIFGAYGSPLGGVEPMEDQMKYITYQPGVLQNVSGTTLQNRIGWWDETIDSYAREETNPVKKNLIQNESIRNGPGGERGWGSRRAFFYYRDYQKILSMQRSLNDQATKLNLPSGFNLAMQLKDTKGDSGNRSIRSSITYLEPYDSVYTNVNAALSKVERELKANPSSALEEQKQQLTFFRKMYGMYEQMAKEQDQLRSDYVKLGIISNEWFKPGKAGGLTDLPEIVERGMVSEMMYQNGRRAAFNIPESQNVTPSEYAKYISENLDGDGPPSIGLDPAGWLSFYAVPGTKWDERIDRAEDHDMLNMFMNRIANNAPKETYETVFAPFVQTVMEQKAIRYEPREVIGPLAYEYGEQLFDGTLRSAQPLIDKQSKEKNNEVSYPNMLVFGQPSSLQQIPTPRHPSNSNPMIACYSPLSSDARVTSLMEFEYDIAADKWIVTTQTSGSVESNVGGVLTPKSRKTIGNSKTTVENFALWRRRHPKFALQILPTLNAKRTKLRTSIEEYEKEQTEGRSKEEILQDTARQEAKKKPNLWLPYPTNYANIDEPRHSHVAYIVGENDTGYYSYLRLPETYNGPTLTNGDPIAQKTVGSRFKTRISIRSEQGGQSLSFSRLGADYAAYMAKRNFSVPSSAVTESLTLPIPNNPKASVQKVVALFVEDMGDKSNRSIEGEIMTEYEQCTTNTDKHNFLQKLEQLCRLQSRNGKTYLSKESFTQILLELIDLRALQVNEGKWNVYANGYAILETLPTNGVFKVNQSTKEGTTPIYICFNGSEWSWKPPRSAANPNPDKWYPVTTVNVPWNGGGGAGVASPVPENITVLRKLAAIQNKENNE